MTLTARLAACLEAGQQPDAETLRQALAALDTAAALLACYCPADDVASTRPYLGKMAPRDIRAHWGALRATLSAPQP